ncbi:MAG: 6-phosphofructokinase [Ruminococcaceae bacterium]|nr:6-phosphofructokinase [Oscillospiraceae bacterium]
MNVLYGNAVVGQSGGPTAAINATLSGIIKGAFEAQKKGVIGTLYGMRNGVEGLLEERLVDLLSEFEDKTKLSILESTPAAALGSCRKKLPKLEENDGTYERLLEIFKKYNIRYFFYIGGNDSMDTVSKLSAFTAENGYEMRIMGVPKTIDNDLVGTDHTPGFGSAAKYIATTVKEIIRDCAVYTKKAVTIVEIMGRDAGWLTAASALPKLSSGEGPDLIYLPERTFDLQRFFADVRKKLEEHPNVVVTVSEGIRFADGKYVGEGIGGTVDAFGHKQLSGAGKVLEMAVKEEIGCKVRSVELNISQRCASHISSRADITESVSVGKNALKAAVRGQSGCMMCMVREEGRQYSIKAKPKPISEIANKVKNVPDNFINAEGNYVTDECLAYILPLVKGEFKVKFRDGLPVHYVIK